MEVILTHNYVFKLPKDESLTLCREENIENEFI
jgi:hypothetical protein